MSATFRLVSHTNEEAVFRMSGNPIQSAWFRPFNAALSSGACADPSGVKESDRFIFDMGSGTVVVRNCPEARLAEATQLLQDSVVSADEMFEKQFDFSGIAFVETGQRCPASA